MKLLHTKINEFRESCKALKSTSVLVTCAMLLALRVLLNYIGTFALGTTITISFGFLAGAMTAYLYGPMPAMLSAGLADVIVYILKPMGAYHPGFTVSAVLSGLIYGLFLYRREVTAKRVTITKLVVDVVINLGLNTYWVNQLQGKAFLALLPARAIKNVLQLPLDVVLMLMLFTALQGIFKAMGKPLMAIVDGAGGTSVHRAKRKGRGFIIAGVVLVWVVLGLWLNNTSLMVDTSGQTVKLMAHRGLSQTFDVADVEWDTNTAAIIHEPVHEYLENTIESMEEAFRVGADMVELDIHRTKDNQLAVFHDYTVEYRTDGQGIVSDYTMDELRKLDIGYGYTADGGKTYPFRGKGVGKMPELQEVLDRFQDKDLLIHLKDGEEQAAELLWEYIRSFYPERLAHLQFYGDDLSMAYLRTQSEELRVMSMASLKTGLLRYIALGWSGYVPESMQHTEIHVPLMYAKFLWGFPARFMQRMEKVDTKVVLVSGDGDWSEGFDTAEQFQEVPENYKGYVWTNHVEILAGLVK